MDYAKWLEERTAVRRSLKALLPRLLPAGARNEAWTPAQVFHHVLLANLGSWNLLERLAAKASKAPPRTAGLEWPVRPELLVFPEQTAFSVEAFSGTAPDKSVTLAELEEMESFENEQSSVLARSAESLDLSRLGFRHPLAGAMNFYEWLCFCTVHEKLHWQRLVADLKA